jgi:hypothetical protein
MNYCKYLLITHGYICEMTNCTDKWYMWLGLDTNSPNDKNLLHIAEVGKIAEIPFPWEWYVIN